MNGPRKGIESVTTVFVAAVVLVFCLPTAGCSMTPPPADMPESLCTAANTVLADVVALDQPIFANRLGAQIPDGMIFALANDVRPIKGWQGCPTTGVEDGDWTTWQPGCVELKDYKRPRPLVLRMNEQQCLEVSFRNLLSDSNVASCPCEGAEAPCTESGGTCTSDCDPLTDPACNYTYRSASGNLTNNLGACTGTGDCTCCAFATGGTEAGVCATNGCNTSQSSTRQAGFHVQGLNWLESSADDGSWVGGNQSSLFDPGQPVDPGNEMVVYRLYAPQPGPFLLYSSADNSTTTGQPAMGNTSGKWTADGGQLSNGLFGSLHVQPAHAEYYRSQVTREEMDCATKGTTATGQPKIDYQKQYTSVVGDPCFSADRSGPVLKMYADTTEGRKLYHSDLTAIITGPKAGAFPASEAANPQLHPVTAYPERLEPYREFTIIYHEMFRAVQAFRELYFNSHLVNALAAGDDAFAINYGMGGIGSEILANRLAVGPMSKCTDCKYEEFFLSSWPNGDPAMVVDVPADATCAEGTTGNYTTYDCNGGAPATKAFYPDDPSNVYHSYLWDHVRFRVLHGGVDLHHLHHLHAHQWLHSPNSPNGHYLDSQAIGPGSAFTMEIAYNGSGNKNLTPGDSIFHCHFYPHFAAGMWSLWRVHDVFEQGTELDSYGRPEANSRAYPDGEITQGTPIPGLVPLPTKPMAPLPAPVRLTGGGKEIEVCTDSTFTDCLSNLAASNPGYLDLKNPGYPFFIPGLGGSRAVHPPLDYALACSVSGDPDPCLGKGFGDACPGTGGTCDYLDGGLPRHVVRPEDGNTVVVAPKINPFDFSKEVEKAVGLGIPEEGSVVEQVAMEFHAQRTHPSSTPEGAAGDFTTNGKPPAQGAPYAEPCINLDGDFPESPLSYRDYWGVDFQTAATFNREGWHYPQQRMISLWGDVFAFLGKGQPQKPPEPFFFRANSFDCVRYRMASLVPKTYELDDFQVRTPTDVLGQHIHLVKFDVTSSDGAANGFNYEDGTFGPDEVVERLNAFNHGGFQATLEDPVDPDPMLQPKFIKYFGTDIECPNGMSGDPSAPEACQCKLGADGYIEGGRWCGSQATNQLWYVDPLCDNGPSSGACTNSIGAGEDRTLRTVFTHDHFSPSTHQQAGLYAGLVAEPWQSKWLDNQTGTAFGGQGVPSRTTTENGVDLKDGGPTSWQAIIQTADVGESYREFLLEFQDTVLMYEKFSNEVVTAEPSGCPAGALCGFCSTDFGQACSVDPGSPIYFANDPSEGGCPEVEPAEVATGSNTLLPSCNFINGIPSMRIFNATTGTTQLSLGWDTTPIDGPNQQPELISFDGATTNFSLSYRNEPLYNRLSYQQDGTPSATPQGDMSFIYSSSTHSNITGDPYSTPLTPGVEPGDPFTPLLRAYAGDNVQVRTLVGAHQNPHNFTISGTEWLFEPSNVNSGWRASQTMGISEHFEMLFQLPKGLEQPGSAANAGDKPWSDYLYKSTAAREGQASGNWGLMRAYDGTTSELAAIPGTAPDAAAELAVCPQMTQQGGDWTVDCTDPDVQCYDVTAFAAQTGLADGKLVYNYRRDYNTPQAILYALTSDLPALKAGTRRPEPLVLRAKAGDCIQVKLRNDVPADFNVGGFSSANLPVDGSTNAKSLLSTNVGLHPQLVSYQTRGSDGANVGYNPVQTVAPGGPPVTYYWYAGHYDASQTGSDRYVPVEFGAANLLPSDPVNQHAYALFGGLVIEPANTTLIEPDPNSYASATITTTNGSFREFVLFMQDDMVIFQGTSRVGNRNGANYGIERLGSPDRSCAASEGVSCVLSDSATCGNLDGTSGPCGTPITPVFCATAGDPVRFRLLHPGGAVTNEVFELAGHTFAEEPYFTAQANCDAPTTQTNPYASQTIEVADVCTALPGNPSLTEWKGSRMGHGPTNHYDVVIDQAGGVNAVDGDYLWRTFNLLRFDNGIWGLFRVLEAGATGSCPSGYDPAQNAALDLGLETPEASSSAAGLR